MENNSLVELAKPSFDWSMAALIAFTVIFACVTAGVVWADPILLQ